MFFPLHDLTHYSVESELGIRDAFYVLVASGWSIEDTTGKGKRGPLPDNAAAFRGQRRPPRAEGAH